MEISRVLSITFVVCLAGGVLSGAPAVAADDCDLATAAAIAQAKVPHADAHATILPGEATTRAEMIFMADRAYLRANGGDWRSMNYSSQAQIDTINGAKKRTEHSKQTCKKGASEVVKGESATVLLMHTEASGNKSDARLWISDKTGLVLKSEIKIDGGNEVAIVTDDFRYDNIEAPAGVK